jgi:phosphatidylglycerophosphatase A
VPICAAAERFLGKRDPGSVVLDEIVVMPLVGLPAVWVFPNLAIQPSWILPLAGFAVFRLFDIWKPGPIRSSQELPGGWGVVMDDVLAALLAGFVILGVAALGVR